MADAVDVDNGETALLPKFLNREKVEKYAACFLRIGWAQTQIDDARRNGASAVVDELAKVAVR